MSRHTHTHQGFTLIEMILVVIVLGILFTTNQLFVATDNSKYYAETCSNYTYGAIKNYFYNALVGKQVTEEGETTSVTPEFYTINITDTEASLGYIFSGASAVVETITLADANPQRQCEQDGAYTMSFAGDIPMEIQIAKNLSSNNAQRALALTTDGNTAYTGTVTMIQNLDDGQTRDITQIRIDTRNQNVTQHQCFIFDKATGDCTQRQQ